MPKSLYISRIKYSCQGVDKVRRFDILYLNEKTEELRSRVALVNSSVNTLDQIFFNIYYKFISKEKVPPFIYPRKQISDLKEKLKELIDEINEIENKDTTYDEEFFNILFFSFAIKMADLESRCIEILSSSQELLLVLEQRILDLEIFDDLKYSENLQHEFIGLTKVFESVDALTYQLFNRTLGGDWIREKKFVPVTILGEKDYSINTETYVTNIPYHDCFRSRYWAGLSHEVAHVFIHHYLEIQDEEFVDLIERNIYKLGIILGGLYQDISGGIAAKESIISQVFELVCDMVACFTCGSPHLLSLCMYDRFSLSEVASSEEQCIRVWRSSHPPLFFRILVMKKTLEHTGILDADRDLREFISSVEGINYFDTEYALQEFGEGFLPDIFIDYFRFTEQISGDVLGFLDELALRGKIERFGKVEFINLIKALRNMKLENPTPVEGMNIVWLKRRTRTFKNPDLSTRDFIAERRNETKIFETMVNLCFDYYERTVFPETKRYLYEEVRS